jgi:uncharacterized membrane protein YcaP (DUF421 family)
MERWFGASWSTAGWVVASTVATYVLTVAVVSSTTTVAQGAAAIGTLLALQIGAGWLRRRSARVRRLPDFAPEVVLRDGEPQLPSGPLTSQLTADELRQQGVFDTSGIALVVLEPTGGLSVVPVADRDGALARRIS